MATVDDLDQAIEQFHLAQRELVKGNPEPVKMMFSHREDVTLLNPISPPARGWQQVAAMTDRAASFLSDGEMVAYETVAKYVTPELAYFVGVERAKAKVGGREDVAAIALRVTMIFRPEDGVWRIVHRHADPITTVQPAESIIQK